MIRARGNLRATILSTFSVLLFLSFALVGLAFNLTVNQYIRSSAISQLNDSRDKLLAILAQNSPDWNNADILYPNTTDLNPRRDIFSANLNAFLINSEYVLLDTQRIPRQAQAIAEALKSEHYNINKSDNRQLQTVNEVFYINTTNTNILYKEAYVYIVYYVDVTELTRFTTTVNLLLLMLVGCIWMMSVVVTTFLASTIARPIRLLSNFAARIGQGDFSANNLIFRNEEFQHLNHNLNYTAKQLALYDNEQKTFFQNVSHELRTPLMSIKCYAEGIKYGLMPPLSASETILTETDRLTEMVDDILYVSKIDNISPTQTLENIDFREILKACVSQQQAVAENRHLVIRLETDDNPIPLLCAPKHLTRAVNNLISNAIRYAKTEIIIRCRKQPSAVVFAVEDDGPGIDADILPHVFERFYKGNGGNHGIGLSIVKSVVEQHRGQVTAQNSDKGAVFTVTIPSKRRGE